MFVKVAILLFSLCLPALADLAAGQQAFKNGDYATAFKEFLPLATQGAPAAQSNVGFLYQEGLGVPQDYKEAVRWFHLAAGQGNAYAQVSLGRACQDGRGVPQDYTEAAKWYRLAAEQGDASGQSNLGFQYVQGQGVPQDDKEAARWFRLAADQGDASAQVNLGRMYRMGQGVRQDDIEAVRWFRLAAEEGDASGQFLLGIQYAEGQGVPQDDKEAVRWFRLAAEQGDATGQFNLGHMYYAGQGVAQDYKEALRWYRLAAEQGYVLAQFTLGLMYHEGQGGSQDYREAERLFRLAAEQGLALGQLHLGSMYLNGQAVRQDLKEAERWFRLAAEQGDAYAQFNLGRIYEEGTGAPQDYVQAHVWFNLASTSGHPGGATSRDTVARKMTRDQIAEAQRRAREWRSKPSQLAALIFSPSSSVGQRPLPQPPSSAAYGGAIAEMPSEDIFSHFASRVILLTCDISADDSMQASGVLVSADGFVVTNAHVVEGCRGISATQISRASRRSGAAVLKYYDKKSDTAVLKVEGQGFEFFDLPARTARVGERVYAIGNPRGLEQSISEGIVSGLREEDGILWIQHSAPISPGSSGGALISSRGDLLGINSWFVRDSQGLNFAVPASILASAYSQARAVQGFLRFPGLPPASQVQTPPPGARKEPIAPVLPPPSTMPGSPSVGDGEQEQLLRKAASVALDFTETLPNYVCEEVVTRYVSESTPANWRAQDIVTTEVVYEGGEEEYRNIAIGGAPAKKSMVEANGWWSTGEYGTNLIDLFKPGTAAQFHFLQDSHAGGVSARKYSFVVAHENSHWTVKFGSQSYVPGYTGNVWIDPATARVLRIEMDARSFPDGFETNHVESATDYEYVRLGESAQRLLPVHAEALSCRRGTVNCSRNTIDFRDYRLRPAEKLVRLNVTVSDKSGRRITNLPQSAFTVLEDGAPQQIKIFKAEDVPVSVGIVIDNSANMREQRPSVRAAALTLVGDSKKDDEVFIVNFSDQAFLDLPNNKDFTNNIGEMDEALGRIDSRGQAAMFDAVRMSINHLRGKASNRKNALVVVTGGNDDASNITMEQLVKAAQESEVLIYAVGLLSSEEKHDAQRARKGLSALAESTGGESFFPKDVSEVARIANQAAHDIRNQYTIAYTPSDTASDGSFRTIRVVVKGPGSPVARTLQGYYATK